MLAGLTVIPPMTTVWGVYGGASSAAVNSGQPFVFVRRNGFGPSNHAACGGAKLPASFDTWTAFPPCAAAPAVAVDLFLCFSQNLSADAEAAAATQTIIDGFTARRASGGAPGGVWGNFPPPPFTGNGFGGKRMSIRPRVPEAS